MKNAFTLIELLVALSVLALLAALAAPPILASIERGRVARVVLDLQTVEVALEAYRTDHKCYPPVVVSCMAADQGEVLQLPQELADGGYLPKNTRTKTSTLLEDPFSPGHTYKYAAPENYWMNGSKQEDRYPVWVPDDFPSCQATTGKADDSPNSPLAWVVWSVGPQKDKLKGPVDKVPLAASTWYMRNGDRGVLARYKVRDGVTWSTVRPRP